MINGLSFFGLNGSGKSTLAHALAKQTDYFEMDAEDYYFPEQKESRKWAMDPNGLPVTEPLGTVPFSVSRTKEEVQNALINDFRIHPGFILSSVTMNWNEAILSRIDLAFLVQTPPEERLKRIRIREEKRFGERALPGGDMYLQQMEFRTASKNRDPKEAEESAKRLNCPIVVLDGTKSVEENLKRILVSQGEWVFVC